MHPSSWQRDEYTISTDRARLDLEVVHGFLAQSSYWATRIPFETMKRSIDHSMPFGVYRGNDQVGFARVITDYATFAYVGDVFVAAEHRGRGLSKWLMEVIVAHPELQGFRRWILATRDAQGLYEKTGFTPLEHPWSWMEMRPVRGYVPGADPLAGPDPAPSSRADGDRS